MAIDLYERMKNAKLPQSNDEILALPEMKSAAFSARLAGRADALFGEEFDFDAFMKQEHGGVIHDVYRIEYVETRDKKRIEK